MAQRALVVDGFDLSTIGLVVRRGSQGIRGSAPVSYPTRRVPGRPDAIRTATRPNYESRRLTVPASVVGATMTEMHDRLHELKLRLAPGPERTVRFVDDESVEFRARVLQVDGQPTEPDQIQPRTDVAITFEADDPRIYEVAEQSIAISGTAAAVPLGTAPVSPVIRLDGSFTDPVLTYRDSAGTVVETLGLSLSKAAGEWVEIDMASKTIVDDLGNSQIASLASGTFFDLDPADGDYPTSAWPTVEVSSGTGTVTYNKAYW